MDLPYFKEIYDPIHGFIKITQEEINVINKLIFQRLHNINQLGALHFVFPTARNTRFSHSLGVLAITSKIIENMKLLPNNGNKIIEKYNLPVDYQRWIRFSALLHDIGHLPYSHCTEHVIENYIKLKYPKLQLTEKFHEWLSGEIIKKTDIYDPKGADPRITAQEREHFSQIINGTSKFILLNQILHSELDADRMDYLVRDSYSTGISFGQIDIDQILRKMFIKQRNVSGNPLTDNIIVYSTSGINAIDNFYYSRMFMYNAVYYHKVSTYFDYLIRETYRIMINSPNLNLINEYLPLKPDQILEPILKEEEITDNDILTFYENWHGFDDYYLWNCFRTCWNKIKKLEPDTLNTDMKELQIYLSLLMERKTSPLIWEKNRLRSIVEEKKEEGNEFDNFIEPIFSDLEKWINNDLIRQIKYPIIVLNQKVNAPLSNVKIDDPGELNDYEGDSILFHDPETNKFHYLNNVASSVNFHSNKSKFHIFRVFFPKIDHDNVIHNQIEDKFQALIQKYLKSPITKTKK